MTRNLRNGLAFLSVDALSACSTQGSGTKTADAPAKAAVVDSRPCIANYTAEGSIWTGRRFASFQEFPKGNSSTAFDQVATTIATKGFQIISTNKEIGLISAAQGVIAGKGATVPINIVVKKRTGGGIRVEATIQLAGGMAASATSIQTTLCDLLTSAE